MPFIFFEEYIMDLSWLPDDGGTGHMPPSDAVINFWTDVKRLTDFKKLVEIGFNAGHSSSIILSLFDDVTIQSYDIGQFDITHKNGIIVKDRFGDRFDLDITDSLKITTGEVNGSDILFIDGGHDYQFVSGDIDLWRNSDIPYVIIDDLQHPGVKRAHNELTQSNLATPVYKQYYTAVLPSWMRDDPSKKPVNVPIELLKRK